MKLKYYLRGLGVGIVVMGLIMIITSLNHKTMSDEEVVQRARELGMEFSTTLNNMNKEESEAIEEETAQETTEAGQEAIKENAQAEVKEETKETETENNTEDNVALESEDKDAAGGNEAEAANTETNAETTIEERPSESTEETDGNSGTEADGTEEYVVLTISPGDGSDRLSVKAQELGLVESSSDFDTFLISNGYANRLRVGSYEVKVGSSYDEIVAAIFR
ncbi:MAG: hypothetical protein K5659_07130 [Lachnospiraceae bacterium]|nr:hypothetical protein [Lachnospiraceae bacterium]